MFKFFKNGNKSWKTALYALIVGIILILLIFALLNINSISNYISGIIGAMAAFIYGFALAFICNPICKIFHKYVFKFVDGKKPHPQIRKLLSIFATYALFAIIIAIALFVILPDVIGSFQSLRGKINEYIAQLYNFCVDFLNDIDITKTPHETMSNIISKLLGTEPPVATDSSNSEVFFQSENLAILGKSISKLVEYVPDLLGSVVTHTLNIIIGFILSIYFLLYKDSILKRTKRLLCAIFPEPIYKRIVHFGKYTNNTFGKYLTGTLCDAVLVGCVITLILTIFGFDNAALIGMVCGITNIIPFFGPFLGAIPSGILIFLQTNGDVWKVVGFAVIILVVQQIDGNIIAPHILGESTGLTPLGIIAAVTFCSHVFGFVGMLIGVPLCAVISYACTCFVEARLKKKNLPTNVDCYQMGTDVYHTDFSNMYDENDLTQEIDVRKLEKLRKKKAEATSIHATLQNNTKEIKVEHPIVTKSQVQNSPNQSNSVLDDDDDIVQNIDDNEMNNVQ